MRKNAAALDIGGSAIKYALISDNDELTHNGKKPTPKTMEEFLNTVDEIISELSEGNELEGIAVSIPGFIEHNSGFAKTGGAVKYLDQTPVRDLLSERYHLPVEVDNDARCATCAELVSGNLKDVDNGAALIVGTAIGGGIVVDRKILRGNHLIAGEISFLCQNPEYYPDYPGMFAVRAGIYGLSKAAEKATGKKGMNGIEIFEQIRGGDENLEEAVRDVTREIARQILQIQVVVDCDRFVIGGGISAEPLFIEYIRDSLKELTEKNPDYPVQPEVEVCRYRNDANLLGAYYHFHQQQNLHQLNG